MTGYVTKLLTDTLVDFTSSPPPEETAIILVNKKYRIVRYAAPKEYKF
jgi:hypothetical protein